MHRLHSAQSPDSCSPEQVKEHSLRLIIRVMRHGNAGSSKLCRCLPESFITTEPSGFLQRQFLPGRPFSHIKREDPKGYPLPGAELPDKGFIFIGLLSPQAMVDMNRAQAGLQFPAELFQQQKQAYGIRAS